MPNQITTSNINEILINGLALGIVVVDSDCNIIRWNCWMEKHSGIMECDIAKQNIFEKFPDIRERNKDRYIQDCIEKGRSFLLSPYIHHYIIPLEIFKDDRNIPMSQNVRIYPLTENNETVGAVIIIRDLTERILYEKEISKLNRVLRGIRNINQLITKIETEDELLKGSCEILTEDIGYILSWIGLIEEESFYAKAIAGIEPETAVRILGKNLDCARTCPVLKTKKMKLIKCSDEPGTCLKTELDIGVRYVCCLPLKVENDVIGVLHICSVEESVFLGEELELLEEVAGDISFAIKMLRDKQQTEQEKERLHAQLRHSQKMESLGVLAGGIAHDFNNILYPIIGYIELIADELPEDSPIRENLNEVYKASHRGKELIQQIQAFGRKDDTERYPMRIYPIVKEALQFMRSSLPSTIKIHSRINKDFRYVTADHTQIYQVVMNLCVNASHAMEGRTGEVEVSLSEIRIDSNGMLPEPGMKTGQYLKLTVSDTGCGMDSTVRERIFEPYYTTKPEGKGTGMGLAVVYGIIKSHNGYIDVYSEPEAGTTFNIYLPQVEGGDTSTQETLTDTPMPTGNESILIVDDEEQNILVLQTMLQRLGYSVTARTKSLELLEIFRNNPENFDLVITDQTMPDMTGAELTVKLMKIRPDIPVILCTGFGGLVMEEKLKGIGVQEYLMKPVVMRKMAMTVRKVLDKN
ncbi:MAG: response regulator [Desulfobacteraceae bacterium]|nr:response regulator [Desulfobacteraceae bacterium]